MYARGVFITLQKNKWNAIAAMSENRVIGKDNQLPWHIPQDMAWFLKATDGQTLVFGRKTFASLQRLHAQNRYVVLTRRKDDIPIAPNVTVIQEPQQIPPVDQLGQAIWICGGAGLYRAVLPQCQYLYLTTVKSIYEGDAVFPKFEDLFSPDKTLHEDETIIIRRYRNNFL